MTRRTHLIALAALLTPATVHAAPKSAPLPAGEDESCSAAHVRAQVLKRDAPEKLLERRAALLACASTPCARSIMQACSGWLQEVEALVPSLVVRVVDARGVSWTSPSLSIDGKVQPPGVSIELDPGEHSVTATVGTRSESRNVLLRSGERGRALEIVVGVETSKISDPAAPIFVDARERPVPVSAWISYGIGAAGLVPLGLGLGLVAANSGTLGRSCHGDNTCPASVADEVEGYQTGRLLIGIGSVVAVAGAVVGTILLFERRPIRQRSAWMTLLGSQVPLGEATP